MSLRANSFTAGNLHGIVYDFEFVGDTLPMHQHTERDVHITIVSRGSFRFHGPEIGDETYKAGAVIDWQPYVDHEFVALEDKSRIVNIVKGA